MREKFLLCSALIALLSLPVFAEQALHMPLASRSLLLDATLAGERLFVVGDHGHILFSDNEGRNWEQAAVPTRAMLTAIDFPEPDRGWAVGHDGIILASTDGGENWTVQRDGLAAQESLNVAQLKRLEQQLALCRKSVTAEPAAANNEPPCDDLEEILFDVEDARIRVEEPVHAPPLLDVYFSNALQGVAVGAFNTLLRTTDGGVSWEHASQALDNPDGFHLNAVTGDGGGRFWIAAEGGLLFASEDAASSWQVLDSPYHGSWFDILRAPDSGALLVFGLRGNLYRSDDQGMTWQAIDVGTDRTLAGGAYINDDYVLLVGGVGTLLVSEDGARSFVSRPSGTRQNLSAVASMGASFIAVGQGGVRRVNPFGSEQ